MKGNETVNNFLNIYTNKKDHVQKYNGGNILEVGLGKLTFIHDNKKKTGEHSCY